METVGQANKEVPFLATYIRLLVLSYVTVPGDAPKTSMRSYACSLVRSTLLYTSYTKTMTFVLVSDFQGLFKKSRGRGRAKAGDIRLKFDIHHTHVDVASRGFWTIEQLQAMGAAG